MKYLSRTVTWRFRDSIELIPELANVASLTIQSPQDLIKRYQSLFKDHVRERFIVFCLDPANHVTVFKILPEGILNSSIAHPRLAELSQKTIKRSRTWSLKSDW